MDSHTRENWKKIKDHLESVGVTDNHFYRRAVAISAGKADPMEHPSISDSLPEE